MNTPITIFGIRGKYCFISNNLCVTAASERGISGAGFKALLGSDQGTNVNKNYIAGRSICGTDALTTSPSCGGNNSINWVLQPNSGYYTPSGLLTEL